MSRDDFDALEEVMANFECHPDDKSAKRLRHGVANARGSRGVGIRDRPAWKRSLDASKRWAKLKTRSK